MIVLEQVTKKFDSVVAIDDLSCHFKQGQTHVLLGSSGCGKSTILRLILGLETPDRGVVRVKGRALSPTTRAELVADMGYVVQEGGLYPHLTVHRNVALAAETRGWSRERISGRLRDLGQLVGFDDRIMEKYPNQLSGGQRQRVGLIRSLMLDPPILLLDEPLGSLDPLVRDGLQQQLKEIFKEFKKTVILVTHDIREAAILGETIFLMTEGRMVQHGTFLDLASRPSNEFVTSFLRAQRLPADIQDYL